MKILLKVSSNFFKAIHRFKRKRLMFKMYIVKSFQNEKCILFFPYLIDADDKFNTKLIHL